MDILNVILTAILSVVSIFLITKIMGHKQVAQLDFFDYVSGITIGSIAAELATELEAPYKPLIALVIYGCSSLILTMLTHKYPRTRKYINGTPTILLHNGKLFRENLKKSKLDLSEFLLMCREQGYFELDNIQTAVFEHNGKLSILPVSKKRPLTPEDMNVEVSPSHIGTELILDGRIMEDNLRRAGLDIKWLQKKLKENGYHDAKEIFLAIYQSDGQKLNIYAMDA